MRRSCSFLFPVYPHPCSCLNTFITYLALAQKFTRHLYEQKRKGEGTRHTLSAELSFTIQTLLCYAFRRLYSQKKKKLYSRIETNKKECLSFEINIEKHSIVNYFSTQKKPLSIHSTSLQSSEVKSYCYLRKHSLMSSAHRRKTSLIL